MTNSIIDQQTEFQARPQPIILTAEEREKAKERCGYIMGLSKNKALRLANSLRKTPLPKWMAGAR